MKQFITIICLLAISIAFNAIGSDIVDDDNAEIVSSEKAVIYFTIPKQEYDQIDKETRWQTDEVLSDFYHHKDKVYDFLETNGIDQKITAKNQIVIKNRNKDNIVYDRKNFKQIVGLIMINGNKKPKVFLGVGTDIDLINMYKDYFEIK